jgi:hypothetical protein
MAFIMHNINGITLLKRYLGLEVGAKGVKPAFLPDSIN